MIYSSLYTSRGLCFTKELSICEVTENHRLSHYSVQYASYQMFELISIKHTYIIEIFKM